jgi:alginate O-acetyltransferase complex protein AlgI
VLFNSLHYLIFLPLVALGYFALPGRWRRLFLLAASYYFYAVFSLKLSLLLIWSALLDFSMALLIEKYRERPRLKKLALLCSLIGNLTPLIVFKYLDFFNASIGSITGAPPWPVLHLALPMGISFYTFETISYTVDVYRGHLKAERSLIDYLLFITYFPHLVAGPILRADKILPQFQEQHSPNGERILSGALLVVWGLLKKVFIADPMGGIVEHVYGAAGLERSPSEFSGLTLLIATYAFAIQIYCDFSAYSDIAIGSGRILGFRIGINFDSPYLATSLRDFWRRWHISLSTWLRDYLYIPLGGSHGARWRTYVNLMLTMLLGGLWHGASWTFVIWGLLHGLFLAGERWFGVEEVARDAPAWVRVARALVTFHLVCLAWVFFRAASASQALGIVTGILTWQAGASVSPLPVLLLLGLLAGQLWCRSENFGSRFLRHPTGSRWLAYGLVAVVATALVSGRSPEFIYFQF